MDNITIDYAAQEAFVKNNPQSRNDLLARFVAGDESLTVQEVASLYYSEPFTGLQANPADIANADEIYAEQRYAVAYYLYIGAIEREPCSLLLLKKAANANYYAGIDKVALKTLRLRLRQLQQAVMATGDGKSEQSPICVVRTSDEYQLLYDIFQVEDVMCQRTVDTCGKVVLDEMTVQVLGEPAPRKVFFANYGETDADIQDFFERKKGY